MGARGRLWWMACRSAAGKIRGEMKRNRRGKGVGGRKGGNNGERRQNGRKEDVQMLGGQRGQQGDKVEG